MSVGHGITTKETKLGHLVLNAALDRADPPSSDASCLQSSVAVRKLLTETGESQARALADTDGVVQERNKIIADAVFLHAGSPRDRGALLLRHRRRPALSAVHSRRLPRP